MLFRSQVFQVFGGVSPKGEPFLAGKRMPALTLKSQKMLAIVVALPGNFLYFEIKSGR